MRFYFVRHGQSEANVINQFSNQNFEIHPLTEMGVAQAEALAEKFRELEFAGVYASPMLRTRQTAEILNVPHGLEIQVTPALREHDAGDLEGRADPEAWAEYTQLFRKWREDMDLDARMPNGESFNDLNTRFLPFLNELTEKYGDSDVNVLLVAHAGILHIMLPQMLENLTLEFAMQNVLANTGVVVVEKRGDRLVCLEWNGVPVETIGAATE